MGDAVEAGLDLGALALCFLAIGLLYAVKGMAQAIHDALNIGFLGIHPFAGIATTLENTLIAWLDDAIQGVEKTTAKFESGLIDSFGMLIAIPALLALGTKAAFQYMWNTALPALLASTIAPVRTIATKARDLVTELTGTVAANLTRAEKYAADHAADALNSARSYVDSRVSAIADTLRGEIADAVAEAQGFANTAVGQLRSAEDNAIANAVELAGIAQSAGLAAAASALAEAERISGVQLSDAEAFAAGEVAKAQAAGQAALDVVRSVAVGVADDVQTIEGGLGTLGVAGIIAAVPAIASLVQTIATESGLENEACRSKVKGICGTDSNAWGELLGGLAALGFAFSLPELVNVAEGVIGELVPLIEEAA